MQQIVQHQIVQLKIVQITQKLQVSTLNSGKSLIKKELNIWLFWQLNIIAIVVIMCCFTTAQQSAAQ